MKNCIRVFSTVTCFALACVGQVFAASNLAVNGDFEAALGSEWTWNAVSGTMATHLRDAASKRSGSFGYHEAAADALGKGYLEQTITGLIAGNTYAITGYVNVYFRADRNWAYMTVKGGGADTTGNSPAKGANTVGSFVAIGATQTADGSGQLKIQLTLDHYATTTGTKDNGCYWDDITVTPVAGAPANSSSRSS